MFTSFNWHQLLCRYVYKNYKLTKLHTQNMSVRTYIHTVITLCSTCYFCYLNTFHFTPQSKVKAGRWMSFLVYKWGKWNLGRQTVMSQRSRVISRPSLHYTASLPLLKSWLGDPQQSCSATPTRPLPPILKGELRCGPTRGVLFNYAKADARLKKADNPPPPISHRFCWCPWSIFQKHVLL